MTLLVGMLCRDAVVIGSDSGTTMGGASQHTVIQPTSKVQVVQDKALIATSGPVGLGQRLATEFDEMVRENRIPPAMRSARAMTLIREVFWKQIGPELQAAAVAQALIGSAAQASAVSSTMLAMCQEGRPRLFQFDQQGAPEEATVELPFVCLGSGQANADPFMAFLRGIFWDRGVLPGVAEGTFAVLWTVEQCIAVSPEYLAGPARIFRLTDACVASEVPSAELDEHRQAVASATNAMRDWRTLDPDVPAPPAH